MSNGALCASTTAPLRYGSISAHSSSNSGSCATRSAWMPWMRVFIGSK